jgi:hypothetical protein
LRHTWKISSTQKYLPSQHLKIFHYLGFNDVCPDIIFIKYNRLCLDLNPVPFTYKVLALSPHNALLLGG